jgi:cytochrome c556
MRSRPIRGSVGSACALLLGAAVFNAGLSSAADLPATAQQKARHDHFHQLGDDFKTVRDLSRANPPDFAALQKAVQAVKEASADQDKWFPKGSGPESGKTRALPAIWTKPADFAAAEKLFSDGAGQLAAAVNASDIEALRAAFRTVGKSCKNCHDGFREPKDDD